MAKYTPSRIWQALLDRNPLSIEQQDAIRHRVNKILCHTVDVRPVRSVCLMLGPYRNLTTLTASVVALHPHCQVLNHGGPRILGDAQLNFFQEYSRRRFERFVKFAIRSSFGGASGHRGGSILLSHAFQRGPLNKAYRSRFGEDTRKEEIHCLFWKESLRVGNQIRDRDVDLDSILSETGELRFIMPVRDPMDAARSNARTGHHNMFAELTKESPEGDIRRRILEEFAWFLDLRDRHPDRFFFFYEHSFNRKTLADLAGFLEVDVDPTWVEAALTACEIKKRYTHSAETLDQYRAEVSRIFDHRPEIRDAMLQFAGVRGG